MVEKEKHNSRYSKFILEHHWERNINQIVVSRKGKSRLKLYDPKKGLIAIAATEIAQRHFSRAKDLAGVSKAMRKSSRCSAIFRSSAPPSG